MRLPVCITLYSYPSAPSGLSGGAAGEAADSTAAGAAGGTAAGVGTAGAGPGKQKSANHLGLFKWQNNQQFWLWH